MCLVIFFLQDHGKITITASAERIGKNNELKKKKKREKVMKDNF